MNSTRIVRFSFFCCLATALVLGSCKSDKAAKTESPYTDYELAMTAKDTTEVTHLIDLFFEYLEHDKVADAVLMLCADDPKDHYADLRDLDNDELEKAQRFFKSFPIVSHRIEYIKFHQTYENEVKVAAIMAEATDDMPEIKTYFYFRPVDYLGSWKLTLLHSNDGDRRIIGNEQADSMQTRYQQELEERERASQAETNEGN